MDDANWSKMTLTEKVKWRNLHPIMNSWHFVDKISAKEIAKQRAPECKVARILEIPKKLDNINLARLPKNYVFKANHGSRWLICVKDDKNISTGETITKTALVNHANDWLIRICGWGNEKQYISIKPRVYFEEFLDDFLECRCFCFNGQLKMIMVDVNHSGKIKSTLYDKEWKRIHGHWRDPEGTDVKIPKNLDKLVKVVEKLAADIDFVRIDIYLTDKDVYFGEFTFTPNGGTGNIHPQGLDKKLGSYWTYDMAERLELKVPKGVKKLSMKSKIYMKTQMNIDFAFKRIRHALKK